MFAIHYKTDFVSRFLNFCETRPKTAIAPHSCVKPQALTESTKNINQIKAVPCKLEFDTMVNFYQRHIRQLGERIDKITDDLSSLKWYRMAIVITLLVFSASLYFGFMSTVVQTGLRQTLKTKILGLSIVCGFNGWMGYITYPFWRDESKELIPELEKCQDEKNIFEKFCAILEDKVHLSGHLHEFYKTDQDVPITLSFMNDLRV